jgi:hypothetical protein
MPWRCDAGTGGGGVVDGYSQTINLHPDTTLLPIYHLHR